MESLGFRHQIFVSLYSNFSESKFETHHLPRDVEIVRGRLQQLQNICVMLNTYGAENCK